MHRFWGWLGLNAGKHWILVLATGGVLTLFFGFGITQLEFSTGQENYLNKSDQVYKDNVAYQELFGGQAMLSLVTMDEGHTVAELFTEDAITQWKAAEQQLRDAGLALDVVSPLTALEWNDNLIKSDSGNPTESVAGSILTGALAREKDPESLALRTADATKTLERVSAIPIAERVITNPEYLDFLIYDNTGAIRKPLLAVFPDDRHAQMVTRLIGNQSIEDEGAAADKVQDASREHLQFENATTTTTGASELLKNVNDYLTGGMATLALIAVVIMALILLVLFSVRWRLLPLGVVLVGVIWAFGIAGYFGIPLTIVTIAGLPVMLGIGIDYAIQMHARVEEEVVIDRAEHPIQETARNLGPALLIVTFDAIFAFAALQFARVPMLREFGLLLIIGVATICVNSIVAPLAILGIREYKSPTRGRDFREGPLGRLVVWMGSLSWKVAPPLAIASVVIFGAGLFVEDKLVLQTDPIQWVNQNSQVIKDLDVIDAETGSSSELGVFVQSKDVFDEKTTAFVDEFTRDQLARNKGTLLTASGLVPTVSDLLDVPGAKHVAPTAEDTKRAFDVAPTDIQKSTIGAEGAAANLIFRTGPSELEARAEVVRDMRDNVHPPEGITATPSGLAVVGVGLLDNLEANRILLTYVAIAFVFLFLAVRLRSIPRALLSLVPVLIAVGAASLFAYFFNLKLSPMTAVGGPLVVAACTEFTSLILLRFIEERRRGLSPREAVDVTASRTGRAFIVSALTAISGVAVIATSSLPLLRDFGIVVAMNVAVALLSALVFLPPMLVWADRRNWVSKGLVPDEILNRGELPDASQSDSQRRGRDSSAMTDQPNPWPAQPPYGPALGPVSQAPSAPTTPEPTWPPMPPSTPNSSPGWGAGAARPLLPPQPQADEPTPPPASTAGTSKRILAALAALVLVIISAGMGAIVATALHTDGGTTRFALPTTPTIPSTPFTPTNPGSGGTGSNSGPLAQGQLPINGTGTLDVESIARRVIPGLVNINTVVGQGQGAGSGIVISDTGAILTNNHVIADSTEVKVTIGGTGPTYNAEVVGYSVEDDVALLQITDKVSGLTVAQLGDADAVDIGDEILAIGNALGKGGLPTVSQGKVTGLDKQVTAGDDKGQTETLYEMIQIDAPIQPGNSGGALVDDQGRVIGVNTAAAGSRYRIQSGNVGFAIRIDNAMEIIKQIQSGQEGNGVHIGARGLLGVNVSELNATNTTSRPSRIAPVDEGALIVGLQSGGGAGEAGIGEGDVIIEVDGTPIATTEDLQKAMVGRHPGDRVPVTWVDVNGDTQSAEIRLIEGPPA